MICIHIQYDFFERKPCSRWRIRNALPIFVGQLVECRRDVRGLASAREHQVVAKPKYLRTLKFSDLIRVFAISAQYDAIGAHESSGYSHGLHLWKPLWFGLWFDMRERL